MPNFQSMSARRRAVDQRTGERANPLGVPLRLLERNRLPAKTEPLALLRLPRELVGGDGAVVVEEEDGALACTEWTLRLVSSPTASLFFADRLNCAMADCSASRPAAAWLRRRLVGRATAGRENGSEGAGVERHGGRAGHNPPPPPPPPASSSRSRRPLGRSRPTATLERIVPGCAAPEAGAAVRNHARRRRCRRRRARHTGVRQFTEGGEELHRAGERQPRALGRRAVRRPRPLRRRRRRLRPHRARRRRRERRRVHRPQRERSVE